MSNIFAAGHKTRAFFHLKPVHLKLVHLTGSAIALVLMSDFALAADTAKSDLLEEVTVTARRREESLQSVPVAVTAISAAALDQMQAVALSDIEKSVPNLSLHVGDAQNAVIYIRGVGQIDSLAFADPGVGVYLDDVYLGRAQGAFLDIFDAERIEVLRGPQGTLYGRNTIGGAVKFVSTQPTNDLKAKASIGYGNYNDISAQAMLSGPIIEDKLLAKAAIGYFSHDGYSDNAFNNKDDGDKETLTWRAALVAKPSDSLTIEITTDGSRDHPDTSRTPSRMTPVFGYPANSDPFKVNADFNDLNKLDVFGVAGKVTGVITDQVTLTSITAYRSMKYDTHLDLDATPFPYFGVFVFEDQNQFSQEFQLSYVSSERLNFVLGAYYFREHDETESGIFGPAIAFVSNSLNDQTNRSYAAYGQASFKVTDRLTATAGLRYTYEEKSFYRIQEFFGAGVPLVPPLGQGFRATDVDTSDSWDNFSPKFGLDFQVTPEILAYASASRGFKSGGFDGRSNSADQALPFAPETLWSYELGLKSTLFGGRATVNIAAFYNDYKNLQLSSFVADENGAFSALFTNAGKATMKGIEGEISAMLFDGFRINGAVGYLDAQYDEFIGPGGGDIADLRHVVNAPKWTLTLAANYRADLGTSGALVFNGDVAYRSKTYPTVSSSEILAQDGYALLNASVGYESPDGRFEVIAGIKNITDKKYISHGFDLSDSLGYQLGYYGAPRTYGVTLRVSY